MKINVEVDLSSFYSEDDNASFTEQIKQHIAWDVKQQVLEDFKKKIGDEFSTQIKSQIEVAKKDLITNTLNNLISEQKIKKYGDNMVSVSEYLNEEIRRIVLNEREIKDFLDKQVKNIRDVVMNDLKERYDLMFASQLISKMNDNGMLKDDVAKLLLS